MKTALDPRHQQRIELMQQLFASGFTQSSDNDFSKEIKLNQPLIDDTISRSAPDWPIDKIAKIDLSILRLAVYELLVQKNQPPKVVIDEAIELAKGFGNDHSPEFVNGVLGTILKSVNASSPSKT